MTTSAVILKLSIVRVTIKKSLHTTNPFTTVQNNSCLILVLEILHNSLSKVNRNAQLILSIIENNSMQLASMTIKNRRIWIARRRKLRVYKLSSPLVDFETVFLQIDAEGS